MAARLMPLALAAAPFAVAAGSFVLAERDKAAECAIVVPAEASEPLRYAAEELRSHVKLLTDVELPISTNGTERARTVALEEDASLGEDAFRLRVEGNVLRVAGGNGRGVLYGVYELLETHGGVSWLSADCTEAPPRDMFAVPGALDDLQRPAFAMRKAPCGSPLLSARLRLNGRGNVPGGGAGAKFGGAAHPSIGFGHTMQWLLPPKMHFAEHPEYFAETGGVRVAERTQPCLTNPDVLRIVTSNVLEAIRRNPDREFYPVTQNDWNNWCTCANCAAVDAEEGSHAGTLVRFVNAVAEAVEKEFPHVKIQTFAYKYTQRPPKKTRLRHNVMLTMCTITADFSEPIAVSRGAHNRRRNIAADMRGWAAQAGEMFVWDYTADFNNFLMPFPNAYSLLPNLRFFRECGAKYVMEEGCQGPGEFAELKTWLLAKGLWNQDVEVKPLIDRFFAGFYGAAAPVVREYFEALQALPKTVGGVAETYTDGCRRKPVSDEFLAWATTNVWPRAEWLVRNEAKRLRNVRLAEASSVYARLMRLDSGKDAAEMQALLKWMVDVQCESGGKMLLREGRPHGNQTLILERWRKAP
ncbi:MAG: DUF4838 domain-containing protein [Kiritimatiellae bacterium]|nr:DUF4838 domain-containing protein [Kiritimatiellia bacterium]